MEQATGFGNSWLTLAGILVSAMTCLTLGVTGVIWPRLWQMSRTSSAAWVLVLVALLLVAHETASAVTENAGVLVLLGAQLVILLGIGAAYQRSQNSPAFQTGALTALTFLAGGANLLLLAFQLEEPPSPVDRKHYELIPVRERIFDLGTAAGEVQTDRGTPISLYSCDEPMDWLAGEAANVEAEFLNKVIRVEPANSRYNCHGWTFTGGRYHIRGSDAWRILQENGYYEVSDPQPGDVIAYWTHDQTLTHTGIVKFTDGQGLVVIESKWDLMGRYLHAPEVQPYSDRYTYLRTDRGSNLVHGLDKSSESAE
ncbi:MAG: hypothetical protein NZM31_02370 [Gemmatales bacterium]|nr:hypothetical protein [Gemmatales bacterium]MDW8385843.1 hypothetical protein [Gemmatales bacterium]